jgi:predicted dehydrogenase
MKVVILGLGQRGIGYLRYLERKPVGDLEILGGVEINPRRLVAARRRFPATTFAAALADFPEADTVLVCTLLPTRLQTIQSLPTNIKHVILEKPIALPSEIPVTIAALVGRTVHVPLVLRFTALYRELRKLAHSRKQPPDRIKVELDLHHRHGTSYLRRQQVEGFLQNKVCHDLDLTEFLLGQTFVTPVTRTAQAEPSSPPPPEGRGTHCSRCPLFDSCQYRFDPRVNNYVLVTQELEDWNQCVYPLPQPQVTGHTLAATLSGGTVFEMHIRLFADEADRRVTLHWGKQDTLVCSYRSRTIVHQEHTKEVLNLSKEKYVGHQDGDVEFLKTAAQNAHNHKHTLFTQAQRMAYLLAD